MDAIDIRFHAVLMQLIKKHQEREAHHLVTGKATDWGDYQKRVGIIEGLGYASQLADQIADEDRGRKRDVARLLPTENA